MRSISLEDVADATSGEAIGPAALMVTRVSTDTRTLKGGELFVAVEGEDRDGHRFLDSALDGGAVAAIVGGRNPHVKGFREKSPDFPLVIVQDTLLALGDLAARVRERLNVEVVGITGSTGKTCTKDLLVSVLGRRYATAASTASYNNEIGVPLTIFGANGRHRLLVVEMGARRPGDIRRLSDIARPDVGIITNVGVTHLQLFGSRESLAYTKGELADSIPERGTLVLNADCEWSGRLRRRARAEVVRFGKTRSADYRYTGLALDSSGRPTFRLRGPDLDIDVRLQAVGAHQAENAAAAAACAHRMGCSPGEIGEGLERARLTGWRLEIDETPSGFTVINDAYNASPRSMGAALETLRVLGSGRRTVAVLGGMEELGAGSRDYHREAGATFTELGLDLLVTVGRRAGDYAAAAREAGLPAGSAFRCHDVDRAMEVLEAVLEPGDVVLVKASRAARLERVALALSHVDFAREGRGG